MRHQRITPFASSGQKNLYHKCYHFDIRGFIMAQIIVRNLDDIIVDRLKARARDNDRSLEAEVRLILEQSAKVDNTQARLIVMERRKKLQGRKFADSVELIREDRDR
jgi:antitoxin FitA